MRPFEIVELLLTFTVATLAVFAGCALFFGGG